MAIFVVVEGERDPRMAEQIREHYPDDHLQVDPGHWLISAKKTAKEVSDQLGLDEDTDRGAAIVYAVSGYYGLHNFDIWNWLSSRWKD